MNKKNSDNISMPKISLRKINKRNLEQVINLNVKPRQKFLVAPNAKSIAQSHYTRGTWLRAIYLDKNPIGLVLLVDSTLKFKTIIHNNPYISLWRFMIDGRYQGKGYGKEALKLVIEYANSRPNVKEISLTHETLKGNAGEFYKKLGFIHTGRKIENELEMKLKLNSD
ncbi:MAG: GNAT family N-acetyltransferase [Promethearchaeota archaeon]|jgi:diamine N-acetyltransferase